MSHDDALPARSQRVHDAVRQSGVTPRIRVLPDSAHTAVAAAAALGCPVGAIANSLVFVADGEPLLVMTSGAHRVDVEVLRQTLGAQTLSMADARTVRAATGQAIGGVAPVGHPTPLRTVIDEALNAFDEVWTAGGTPNTVMPLTPAELGSLTGGHLVRVATD